MNPMECQNQNRFLVIVQDLRGSCVTNLIAIRLRVLILRDQTVSE